MASHSKFYGKGYTQFTYLHNNEVKYDSTEFTFAKIDYSAYDEVRFGIAMVYTGGNGALTIDGVELTGALNGHWYYVEAVITNGYLILLDSHTGDGAKKDDPNYKQYRYFYKVKLSDEVYNGTESLVIKYQLENAYGWFEVTDMIATNIEIEKK